MLNISINNLNTNTNKKQKNTQKDTLWTKIEITNIYVKKPI